MDYILLGGSSVRNRDWIEKISEKVFRNKSTKIVYYKHWSENCQADLDYEVEKLAQLVNNQRVVIFAKSFGIIVCAKAIYERKINPKCCVFLGLPIREMLKSNPDADYERYFKNFKIKTLFVQNTKDPMMNSLEVNSFIIDRNIKNYKLLYLENDTHDYEDYETLDKKLKLFFLL